MQRSEELILLRNQFHLTYESLKPINLIRHTFEEVSSSNEIKEGMLNNVIGLTTGYFSKAILIGSSANPIKKILGALLQFTVATLVAQNAESIKTVGKVVLDKLLKKPADSDLKISNNGNTINI
jgi:hypothetical protein